MSYHIPARRLSSVGGFGALGVNVDSGEELIIRFQVSPEAPLAGWDRVAAALVRELNILGFFEAPRYAGGGSGTNRGLVIIRITTRSGGATLRRIADWMPGVAQRASRAAGVTATFTSVTDEDNHEEFAQTAGGGGVAQTTGPLAGLTQDQVNIWNLLDRGNRLNAQDFAQYFGTGAPEYSFSQIIGLGFIQTLSRLESAGQYNMARSLVIYSLAQNTKALLLLPDLFRSANRGSTEAAEIAQKTTSDLRQSNEKIAELMLKIKANAPSVSGLGALPAGVILVAKIVAVIVVSLALIASIHLFLKSMKTNVDRGVDYCRSRAEATGVPCTPKDYDDYIKSLPPGADEALGRALNSMAESFGTAAKIFLVGGAVFGVAYIGYKLFGKTPVAKTLGEKVKSAAVAVKEKAKTSVSRLREKARARFGGGGTPRALPSSTQ